MRILTISDGYENGKGNKSIVVFHKHIYLHDVYLRHNTVYVNKSILHLNEYDVLFFDVNEDLFTYTLNWNPKLKQRFSTLNKYTSFLFEFVDIAQNISSITIYNNPKIGIQKITNKYNTYESLKEYKFKHIEIPKYALLSDVKEDNIHYYPVVLKDISNSDGYSDICHTYDDIKHKIDDLHLNINEFYISEFINSYIRRYDMYVNVRLMTINNQIIEMFVKANNHWNIHVNIDIGKHKQIDEYVRSMFPLDYFQDYVDVVFKTFGHGMYSHDFVVCNNIMYLCELGYKYNIDDFKYPVNIRQHLQEKKLSDINFLKKTVFEIISM